MGEKKAHAKTAKSAKVALLRSEPRGLGRSYGGLYKKVLTERNFLGFGWFNHV